MVTAGVGETWPLPEIVEGDSALAEIIVEPDASLTPFITFDDSQRSIVFTDEEAASESLAGRFMQITIRLLDTNQLESRYVIYVQVIVAS